MSCQCLVEITHKVVSGEENEVGLLRFVGMFLLWEELYTLDQILNELAGCSPRHHPTPALKTWVS